MTTIYTPPGTPPSPTASLYDMSDDDEGDYNTIRSARTGKGVKLLYSKSKVYVHPSPSAKDNIPGFIALVQQRIPPTSDRSRPPTSPSTNSNKSSVPSSSLLLAWVPESSLPTSAYDAYVKVDLSQDAEPPRQSFLVPPPPTSSTATSASPLGTYAFAVPVSEIYSLLVRPPSVGWWYGSVVINTRAGGGFPALFFHDSECQSTILQRKRRTKESFDPFGDGGGMFWGGDEVLRWLKQYVAVERAEHDLNVFLVEPSAEDRLGFGTSGEKGGAAKSGRDQQRDRNRANQGSRDGAMDPLTKTLKEARWGLLEKFSQVTTFARRAAKNVADHPSMPPQARRLIQNPEVQTIQEEFDSARIYLARWAMGIAEQSEKERSQRIWTAKDVLEMEETPLGDFEILDVDTGGMSLEDRRRPVTVEEWETFFNPTSGVLQVTVDEVKERIFHGGLDPDDGVRKEAWLFLLGVYDWRSTREQRQNLENKKRDEYLQLKGKWWERMAEQDNAMSVPPSPSSVTTPAPPPPPPDSSIHSDQYTTAQKRDWWRDQRARIEKDVHRTDRHVGIFAGEDIPHPDPDSPFADVGTNVHLQQMKDMLLTYNEYNTDLGYVQGMSDLLAPIYAVMQDDALAFWAFGGFMKRMERNFLRSQAGMRLQLLTLDHLVQLMDPALYIHLQRVDSTNFFFFFRMLLVWYKREFAFHDVLRLWESLWTDYYSANFHLFIALAILEKHRSVILEHLRGFDEVLKYVNELSNKIDLPSTLLRAESLFKRFERTVEAVDRKTHFPAPSTTGSSSTAGPSGGGGDASSPAAASPSPQGAANKPPNAPASNPARNASTPSRNTQVQQGQQQSQHPTQQPARPQQQRTKHRGMQRLSDQPRPSPNDTKLPDPTDGEGKVISPELRGLLRRDVEVVDVVVGVGTGGTGGEGGEVGGGTSKDADSATTPESGGQARRRSSGAGV